MEVDHLSFFMSGAISVQMRYQSMEIIDSVDNLTPTYGDCVPLLSRCYTQQIIVGQKSQHKKSPNVVRCLRHPGAGSA